MPQLSQGRDRSNLIDQSCIVLRIVFRSRDRESDRAFRPGGAGLVKFPDSLVERLVWGTLPVLGRKTESWKLAALGLSVYNQANLHL